MQKQARKSSARIACVGTVLGAVALVHVASAQSAPQRIAQNETDAISLIRAVEHDRLDLLRQW
ncbi:MAG TPA: hypothetical protein VFM15_03190, partial [Gammaproteobacteria bacterium]|nr:hypothetical protein [Gammaproteobacteria bacterium]